MKTGAIIELASAVVITLSLLVILSGCVGNRMNPGQRDCEISKSFCR